MKLYKLSQCSTFDNLEHFIYITNEYGVPSTEFVDAFIEQFGKVILNGNFILSQTQLKQLDGLWSDIVKECEQDNIEYNENYGAVFYNVLSQKALYEIKKDYEQSDWNKLGETKKIELLKEFIEKFDDYIEAGIDMKQLYFENTPDLVKTDEYSREYIDVFLNNYEANSRGKLYVDGSIVILQGSKVQPEKPSSSVSNNRRMYTKDLILLDDLIYNSVSGAGNFVRGQATNGWMHWKNANGQIIDIYRYRCNNVQTQVSDVNKDPKEYNKHNIDKRAEDAARLHALINNNTGADIVNVVSEKKYHYRLTDEMYIGHKLTITESVGDIKSQYKAKVIDSVNIQSEDNDLIVNINEFIEEIESSNVDISITMGFFKFKDIYMEEN